VDDDTVEIDVSTVRAAVEADARGAVVVVVVVVSWIAFVGPVARTDDGRGRWTRQWRANTRRKATREVAVAIADFSLGLSVRES